MVFDLLPQAQPKWASLREGKTPEQRATLFREDGKMARKLHKEDMRSKSAPEKPADETCLPNSCNAKDFIPLAIPKIPDSELRLIEESTRKEVEEKFPRLGSLRNDHLIQVGRAKRADFHVVKVDGDKRRFGFPIPKRVFHPYKPAAPCRVVRPQVWTAEAENVYRFNKAGYRDEVHYRITNGMDIKIERWKDSWLIKKLLNREGNTMRFPNHRDVSNYDLQRLKLLDYNLQFAKQDQWRIALFQSRFAAVQREAKTAAEMNRVRLLKKLHKGKHADHVQETTNEHNADHAKSAHELGKLKNTNVQVKPNSREHRKSKHSVHDIHTRTGR